MTRNRRSAKKAGASFETAIAHYLSVALDDERIQRLRLHGSKDVGDIGNVYYRGEKVTVECKNTTRHDYWKHYMEAVTEAGNNDSPYPWVVQKKPGVGIATLTGCSLQHAFTHRDVLARMGVDPSSVPSVSFIGRDGVLACITVRDFASIVNHELPLGKDE